MTVDPIQNGAEVGAEAVRIEAVAKALFDHNNRRIKNVIDWEHLDDECPGYREAYEGQAKAAIKALAALAPPPAGEGGLREALTEIYHRTYSNDEGCVLREDAVAEIADIAIKALTRPAALRAASAEVVGEGGLRDRIEALRDEFHEDSDAYAKIDAAPNSSEAPYEHQADPDMEEARLRIEAQGAALCPYDVGPGCPCSPCVCQMKRDAALRAASAEVERAGGLSEACKPWKFGVGDPPDYYSPLMGVYSAGVTYAIQMLASLTDAGEYVSADGSESFEGDVSGTIMNVLKAAKLYDDEDGTWATLTPATAIEAGTAEEAGGDEPCPRCRGKGALVDNGETRTCWRCNGVGVAYPTDHIGDALTPATAIEAGTAGAPTELEAAVARAVRDADPQTKFYKETARKAFGDEPDLRAASAEVEGAGGDAPDGGWLWSQLMDYCKARRLAPASHPDLFAIVGRARALTPATAIEAGTGEKEMPLLRKGVDEVCKVVLSASYGPPSSWPGDYPKGWKHPPCWTAEQKPTPDQAAWHDNGVRDAWFAVRNAAAALSDSPTDQRGGSGRPSFRNDFRYTD